MDVFNRFGAVLDNMFPTVIYIEQLLERGVKVLVYVGDVDWICNWVSSPPSEPHPHHVQNGWKLDAHTGLVDR